MRAVLLRTTVALAFLFAVGAYGQTPPADQFNVNTSQQQYDAYVQQLNALNNQWHNDNQQALTNYNNQVEQCSKNSGASQPQCTQQAAKEYNNALQGYTNYFTSAEKSLGQNYKQGTIPQQPPVGGVIAQSPNSNAYRPPGSNYAPGSNNTGTSENEYGNPNSNASSIPHTIGGQIEGQINAHKNAPGINGTYMQSPNTITPFTGPSGGNTTRRTNTKSKTAPTIVNRGNQNQRQRTNANPRQAAARPPYNNSNNSVRKQPYIQQYNTRQ
jgi:hypothetical protein